MRKIWPAAVLFLSWWRKELVALVPRRLRAFLARHDAVTQIEVQARDVHVHSNQIAQTSPKTRSEALRGFFFGETGAARLLLADDLLFRKTLIVPRQFATEIEGAVGYQLERYFPMERGHIYFGCTVRPSEVSSENVEIELVAVRRDVLERRMSEIEAQGYHVKQVVTKAGWVPLQVGGYRAADVRRKACFMALCSLVVFQIFAVPTVLCLRLRSENADLQRQLTALVAKTKQATEIRQVLDARLGQLRFLAQQQDGDTFSPALNQLSTAMPDTIWVSDLQFDGQKLQVNGVGKGLANWSLQLQGQHIFQDVRLETIAADTSGRSEERFRLAVTPKPAHEERAP